VTTIRPATADDARALAALRWEFRAAQDPPAESREDFLERCATWMVRELSADGPWRAWVAVRDGSIAGQIWVNLIEKIPNPAVERERHAYLSNLFVTPDARGGVGTQLLEAVLAWCAAHGIDRVVLWPSKRSVTLYSRHGFVRDGGVMELTL